MLTGGHAQQDLPIQVQGELVGQLRCGSLATVCEDVVDVEVDQRGARLGS